MKSILVTGATGILGSNVCEQLVERGDRVRALVRNPDGNDALALRQLGVELVAGELVDRGAIERAVEGTDGIVHSAAMLGRPGSSIELGFSSNVLGTLYVQSAAWTAGNIPLVQVLTTTFFDMWDRPLTEQSALDLAFRNTDPYSITKRLGYVEGVARVADGQDIRFMLPGAIYGPTVCLDNGVLPTSFNGRILAAIKGELMPMVPLPIPFSHARDCAYVCVAALDRGRAGERYIAHGRSEDISTLAGTLNQACRIAGSPHEVEEVHKERLRDPDMVAKYATLAEVARRDYPVPFSTSHITQERLGYRPTPLEEGLRETVEWLRRNALL